MLFQSPVRNTPPAVMPHIDKTKTQSMRRLLLTIVIILKCFISIGQEYNNSLESILYECLNEGFKSKGIDIELELNELENELIRNNILETSSKESYFNFYKKVVESNDIIGKIDYRKFEKILSVKIQEYYSKECLDRILLLDSMTIKASKYYQLNEKNNESALNGKISPSIISRNIVTTLSPQDFENKYYRANALLSILHIISLEVNENEPKLRNEDYHIRLVINVTSKNQVFIENKEVSFEELKSQLEKFIKFNKENHKIIFISEKETKYNFYIKVQNSILETYSTLRDKMSFELYRKAFQELTDSEKNEVTRIYPTRIFEE